MHEKEGKPSQVEEESLVYSKAANILIFNIIIASSSNRVSEKEKGTRSCWNTSRGLRAFVKKAQRN